MIQNYSGILLSHKNTRTTATYDNVDGSRDYHAKKKSDQKSQEPYDVTHMWDIKLKGTNEQRRKTNKQKLMDTTAWWLPEGKGGGGR